MPSDDDELEAARARIHVLEATVRELAEREGRLRSITENAPDYILGLDRDGIVTYMNRPPPGHTLDEMIGRSVERLMEPSAHSAFRAALALVFETAKPHAYESIGSVSGRAYVNRLSPLVVDGEVESAVLVTHDITELRHAQEELRGSEEQLRAVLDASFEGLLLSVAAKGVMANETLARMVGTTREKLVGVTPQDFLTPESAREVVAHIQSGDETPYEVVLVREDGTRFPAEILGRNIVYRGQPARITGIRDLTDRRRAEEERRRLLDDVREAQRLESLGMLAGGIAHDFNNLLLAIMGNAELAKREGSSEGLDTILEASRRASELCKQMLVYAGANEPVMDAHDLGALVRDTASLIAVSVPKKATLALELATDLPPVHGDAGQLRQVAMNLITNAAEALGGEAGAVTLRVGVEHLDADALASCRVSAAKPGRDHVYLEVADTGAGMDAETAGRVFEPFFSTKFAGRGMGLASVLGIVRSHRGAIRVDTEPGRGTRFRVLLPIARPTRRVVPVVPARAHEARFAGRVLLADDEPLVGRAIAALLRSLGFEVVRAADGEEAVTLVERDPEAFMLAVLDESMPRASGSEALHRIRTLRPDLPALRVSGLPVSGECCDRCRPNVLFLSKPFDLGELGAAVEALVKPADPHSQRMDAK